MVKEIDNKKETEIKKVLFFYFRKGLALRKSIKRKRLEVEEMELMARYEKAKYELKISELTNAKIAYEQSKCESKFKKENDIQGRQ